jgi:hypothetical protein
MLRAATMAAPEAEEQAHGVPRRRHRGGRLVDRARRGPGFVGQFTLLQARPGLPLIRTATVRGAPCADLFEAAEAGCQAGIAAARHRQGDSALIPLPFPPGPLPV